MPPEKPSFEIPPTVLFREVDQQMVLLNIETEEYFGLNQVGADIITRLTSLPFASAFSALTRDYEVDPEILRRDTENLVERLVQAGLLHRVAPVA